MKKLFLALLLVTLLATTADAAVPATINVTLKHDGIGVTSYVLYLLDGTSPVAICEGATASFACANVTLAYGDHKFAASAKGPGGESAKSAPFVAPFTPPPPVAPTITDLRIVK